jgi:hypothetical protein
MHACLAHANLTLVHPCTGTYHAPVGHPPTRRTSLVAHHTRTPGVAHACVRACMPYCPSRACSTHTQTGKQEHTAPRHPHAHTHAHAYAASNVWAHPHMALWAARHARVPCVCMTAVWWWRWRLVNPTFGMWPMSPLGSPPLSPCAGHALCDGPAFLASGFRV